MAVAPGIGVEVLGPLRLLVGGRPVEVRGPKRRALLALLAIAEGRAVTVEALLDALWPADLPESARGALHSHVFRLRGQLGPAGHRLERLDAAYRLDLDADDLDAARARSLLARARLLDDPAAAHTLLREARGLWRGPVLAEFVEVEPLAATAVALEQVRREVTDALLAAAIEAGRVDGVVELAADAVAADPLREPAVLLQMRALAATGQAPQALRVAREFRRLLSEETGLDPSPAVGELERAIAAGTVAAPAAGTAPLQRVARPAAVARPATPLVGRDAQVAAVARLLADERLVTVVGPGGVGKTRLALEVARRSDPDLGGPVAVLRLAPVTDGAAIPHALAAALDLRVARGDVLAACVALLGAGPGLLVIDNCEHLLDAVRDVAAALLEGCPELTVLATSREPLGLPGECSSRLAPLPVPAPDGTTPLQRVPSVAVFLDRARRVRPGFAPDAGELRRVADIVRRLDGVPLAIELAAGRLSTFTLAELAQRLDRSLDLLGGARPAADARHRTLRATIEWSYRLLPADEQRLFRHLAVFVDGVDLRTAEEVAAGLGLDCDPGSALAHLVDASMIEAVRAPAGGSRYRMLETLRAFGVDRLAAAGEREAASRRLVSWARDLVAWIDTVVFGDDEPRADAALRCELPNLRAAWRLARGTGDLDAAVAMVAGLYEVSVWRDVPEIRGWAEELAGDRRLAGHPRASIVLVAASQAAYMRGDPMAAQRWAGAALECASDDEARGLGLRALALVHLTRGDFAAVVELELAAAPLAPRPDGGVGIAALAATYAGELDRARELNGRMAEEATSPTLRAFTAYVEGEIDSAAGRRAPAEKHYTHAIELARSSGATFVVGIASVGLLTVLAEDGRVADALRGYRDVIDYFAGTGNWSQLWTTLRNLARLLRALGDDDQADLLDNAADAAPDAPAAPDPPRARRAPGAPGGRARALDAARRAIGRHLAVASTRVSSPTPAG